MKITVLLLTAATFAAFSAFAQNRSVKFETGSFAEVLAKAKKENKPIMMDAYTTWCGPCKMMDKQVFTNDAVADFYNANFVAYKVDMEKGEGPELGKKFEVQAYPNFLFIAPDGSLIHRATGAKPPQAFIADGIDALNPEKRYAALQKKYESGNRDPDFLVQFINAKGMAALDNSTEMKEYLAKLNDAQLLERRNWEMIRNFTNYTAQPGFDKVLKQRDAFSGAYTKDSVDMLLLRVYENELYNAKALNKNEELVKLKTELKKLKVKNSEKILLIADAHLYLKNNDLKNYGESIIKLVDTYYAEIPPLLNNYAWDFYKNISDKKMLGKAEIWANKAVQLDPSSATFDTHAAVLYKLGKKKEARAAAENAITLGQKSGEDVSDTEALLKKINAK